MTDNNGKKSWHERKGLIALFAGLIAIIPPLTTAIHGTIKGNNDFELAEQIQNHTVRTHYLEKAIDQPQEITRARYLRYLVQTEKDSKFREWAVNELKIVDDKISDIKAERDNEIEKAKLAFERQRKAEERLYKIELEKMIITKDKLQELELLLKEATQESILASERAIKAEARLVEQAPEQKKPSLKTYNLFRGEYASQQPKNTVFLGCGDPHAYANSVCKSDISVSLISTRSGNKCGYSTYTLQCVPK